MGTRAEREMGYSSGAPSSAHRRGDTGFGDASQPERRVGRAAQVPAGRGATGACDGVAAVRRTGTRVISDCRFGETATEYVRQSGIMWLSCTAK
jgi:hypothetical protein